MAQPPRVQPPESAVEVNVLGQALEQLEDRSKALLASATFSRAEALEVFDSLPTTRFGQGRGFSVGYAGSASAPQVRRNTTAYPAATRYLCAFAKQHCPHHRFTSIAVLENSSAPLHIDMQVCPGTSNVAFGLSSFSNGEIFVERQSGLHTFQEGGRKLRGDNLSLQPGPAVFRARDCRHATLPWQGRRVILVAYTADSPNDLSHASKQELLQAGFLLPDSSPHANTPARPCAFEIFSGSGVLSRALLEAGFEVIAVDHLPRSTLVPVVRLDLTDPHCKNTCWSLLRSRKPCVVHLAPPCGTASRARERRISSSLRKRGVPEPKPLRSAQHPLGLPSVKPNTASFAKVTSANKLYELTFDILCWALNEGCSITIENPTRSWFWAVLALHMRRCQNKFLRQAFLMLQSVVFDSCMHGGTRPKSTKLLCSDRAFSALALQCDGAHAHDPWKPNWSPSGWVFSTHLEATYPVLLCKRMAKIFAAFARAKGSAGHRDSLAGSGRPRRAAQAPPSVNF